MTSADSGPVIGVDLGKARIGVAVSDGLRLCANPLSVLRAHGTDEDIDALVRLAREHDAVAFVVGLPLNMDGTESDGSRAARELSAALERAGGLPRHAVGRTALHRRSAGNAQGRNARA
ncbi:MAG: Holliday junction resolvase RuvX [Deltaproteobacteria bacterium]|nr:Holliday junction resolvase RuvX [Deltaproteobacteria bacterium]